MRKSMREILKDLENPHGHYDSARQAVKDINNTDETEGWDGIRNALIKAIKHNNLGDE